MDDYARHVLATAPERAIFAGLSMGGYVCFAIARLAPERVGGLILIDTRETADTDEGRKGRFESIEKVKQHGVQAVVDAMLPKMVKAEQYKARVREIMMSSSQEGVIAALRAMANRPDFVSAAAHAARAGARHRRRRRRHHAAGGCGADGEGDPERDARAHSGRGAFVEL